MVNYGNNITGPVTITGAATVTGELTDNADVYLPNSTVPAAPASGIKIYAAGGGLFAENVAGATWPLLRPGRSQSGPMPGALAETADRYLCSSSASPSSGVLTIMQIALEAGESIGHIGFGTGTTPTTSATHWWAALLDVAYTQQAHSADQGAVNLAASTWYSLAMVTPYTASYTGIFYLALLIAVSAGSVASILAPAVTPDAQFITGSSVPTPLLGGPSTTALTTPGTDGSTVYAAPTAAAPAYYMYAAG